MDDTITVEDAPPSGDDQQDRLHDATLALIARWGVAKTSLADVAKEAGCSRATLYRAFPGGKRQLFATLTRRELRSAADSIIDAFETGDDLADALTRALVVGARLVRDHDAAAFVLAHEPELVLPYLGFGRVDRAFERATATFGPTFATRLPADRVPWAVEWSVRVFISFVATPDAGFDLTDATCTRGLIERFLAPAFAADVLDPTNPTHAIPA